MDYVRVALDVPLNSLFDYRADNAAIGVGNLVLVPFGRKIVVGVVMAISDSTALDPARVRSIIGLVQGAPALPAEILSILQFCSDYYHHPIGEVVLNALPTRLRRRNAIRMDRWRYRLTDAGKSVDPVGLPPRAVGRRRLMTRLSGAIEGLELSDLSEGASRIQKTLDDLIERGWVEKIPAGPISSVVQIPVVLPAPVLIESQHRAVEAIKAAFGRFAGWLLHGVTGSGKTEVYLALIAHALENNKQALLLVPEINLTPQLEARVRERFPNTAIVILNSALNESDRLHGWASALSGKARIVLGTRLAVFTPMPDLGLIIVDEEHDPSFKQGEGLRYSARDIALLRAKRRGVPVLLGSATPALETYQQALSGRYGLLELPHRANAAMPVIQFADIRGEKLIDGLAQPILHALRETIDLGEQSLVYINRRGFAPVLICTGCGWTADCPRCSSKLVVHLSRRQLHCHHCGRQENVPVNCPKCGNVDLAPLGQGTQRVESALARIFPTSRILRIDRDSTRNKGAWNKMRRQIHDEEVDVLVGTQMLAKGHDFPALTLVCVINADSALYSSDFRASERLFANLMQVAGRAGRAERPGRVLIQTEFPQHPLYAALQRQDFAGFANQILSERKQAGLPPFSYQAILRAEATEQKVVLDFLTGATTCVDKEPPGVTIFDPVPANMARLAGKERGQLTVQSQSRSSLQIFLRMWVEQLDKLSGRKVRWALDVDAQEP
jgi:primosomal protein N' (replication factor Y)